MTWQPIETAPKTGQFLVTDDDLPENGGYSCIELVNAPFLKDGRILNQNSGNYSRPGVWKFWAPVPAPITAAPDPSDTSSAPARPSTE